MGLLHRHKHQSEPPERRYQTLLVDEHEQNVFGVPDVDDGSEPDLGYRDYLIDFARDIASGLPRPESVRLALVEGQERPVGSGNFDMDRQVFTRDVPLTAGGRIDAEQLGSWCYMLQKAVIAMRRAGQHLGWFVHVESQGDQITVGILHRTLKVDGVDANLTISLDAALSDTRQYQAGDEAQELAAVEYRVELEDRVGQLRESDEQQDLHQLETIVERQVSEEDRTAAEQMSAGSVDRVRGDADSSLLG